MTVGGLPPQSHSDDLTLLKAGLDAMVATSLDSLSVSELLERACTLQTLSAQIDAARAAVLAAADSASESPGVLRGLGFRNASQVVAAETGAPAREIHATARTGRWLIEFPIFAQAAADGVLTLRHLRELKGLDKPHRRDALVASQDELVAAARDHDFVEFGRRVATWLINHTTDDEVKEQVKKTSCTWQPNADGSIDGRFHLDPLSAVAVGTALGDEMQHLFRQQSEGDGKPDTITRRRGQALVGLIVGGAEAPGSATTTPLVNLVIGQKILENLLERFLDPSTPAVPVDRDDPDFRCEAIDGTPIHPDLAFAATAAAEFERIVLDEKSRIMDMSVKARGFPPWMRTGFGLASQVQPEFAEGKLAPSDQGRSCDVCRRQTRVCRTKYGNTSTTSTPTPKGGQPRLPTDKSCVTPTISGSATSSPDRGAPLRHVP